MKLILASKSPRRKEILQREGFTFEIVSKIQMRQWTQIYHHIKML